jgi:hypothetical protein
MNYPAGVDLIASGQCPTGKTSPMACMFCMTGHILECHFPLDCQTAGCSHAAGMEKDLIPELLEDLGPHCEFCGCSEFDPCPEGCAWSERFAAAGRAVCTRCEHVALAMEINMGALGIWRCGSQKVPIGTVQNHNS